MASRARCFAVEDDIEGLYTTMARRANVLPVTCGGVPARAWLCRCLFPVHLVPGCQGRDGPAGRFTC